jgi:hypothetical protein
MKVLCLVPTLPEDLNSECLPSINRQTCPVSHVALVTQRVRGGFLCERVSYVLNKALERFDLQSYDYLLRVDGDTVLPINFIRQGILADCDLYGTIGFAMLIKVKPFMDCMNGRFCSFDDDTYVGHCFRTYGYTVLAADLSKVKTRRISHPLSFYLNKGATYYRIGYTFQNFVANIKPRQPAVSIFLLGGFILALLGRKPKSEFACKIWSQQLMGLAKLLSRQKIKLLLQSISQRFSSQ